MKIGFCLYGTLCGKFKDDVNRFRDKDFRHCWPNIKNTLIQPFIDRGHQVKIFISSYKPDEEIENDLFDLINPDGVYYSDLENSTPFTSKIGIFENNLDGLDFIIATRLDLHWNKPIIEGNIIFDKFNFLFREKGWWHKNFTCDNFYAWPHRMTPYVKKSLIETLGYPRNGWDTHALSHKLSKYISYNEMNIISDIHQLSDVNEYFTICKKELGVNRQGVHPEVLERFGELV